MDLWAFLWPIYSDYEIYLCLFPLKGGLKMNIKKTETMVISRDLENPKVDIKVDGTTLEQVETFKYLGQRSHLMVDQILQ